MTCCAPAATPTTGPARCSTRGSTRTRSTGWGSRSGGAEPAGSAAAEYPGDGRDEGGERLTAMAAGVLLLRSEFRGGLPQAVRDEHRVVSEAVRAPLLVDHPAAPAPSQPPLDAVGGDECGCTDEGRPPPLLRDVGELAEQQRGVRVVVPVPARPPRR